MTEPVEAPLTPSVPSQPVELRLVPQVVALDLLTQIFQGQQALMLRYHQIEAQNGSPVILADQQGKLDDRQVQARLHQLFGFALREWAEAMQELKNKPWRQTENPTDRTAFVNEVGDVFHFFVEFCITAGITPSELHQIYFKMHDKNVARQSSNY